MTWLAVLGTLLGTALGAAATLAAQQIAARAAEKRERIQRRADLRRELKNEIDAYLDAAQEAERVASDRDKFDHATITLVTHTLWMRHKQLALICSDELVEPLDQLTNTLHMTLWNGPPEGVAVWQHLAYPTGQFRSVARREVEWKEAVGTELVAPGS